MIQADRPMCKEYRHTTRVILAKTGSYFPQKRLQYITDANK